MEKIIFKDLKKYYYIENGRLLMNDIDYHFNVDLSNIPLLDDAEVLYHHRYTKDGELYPVYYQHENTIITKIDYGYTLCNISGRNYIKDYTLVNLKMI